MPDRLYKYQPFTAQTLENLKDRTLWFSAAARFNDPYDCALSVHKTELTDEELSHALEYLVQRTNKRSALEARFKPNGVFTEEFRSAVINGARDALENRTKVQVHERGVACLAEDNRDLLMWAHYADGHRGFCLEFDGSVEPFSKARRVVYSSEMPRLSPVDILNENGKVDLVEKMILTKASCWAYEREWRIPHLQANLAYTYPWQALMGLYFGAAMPRAQIEIVALILQGSPTKLYQMQRSSEEFSVSEHPVTYTPFRYE
jgi:DUF2971 family protein